MELTLGPKPTLRALLRAVLSGETVGAQQLASWNASEVQLATARNPVGYEEARRGGLTMGYLERGLMSEVLNPGSKKGDSKVLPAMRTQERDDLMESYGYEPSEDMFVLYALVCALSCRPA